MTVYSINKRVMEQAQAAAQTKSTTGGAADQFLAALNQAGSKLGVNAAEATSQAEKSLNKVFDKPKDEAPREAKATDKPKRVEKDVDRGDRRDAQSAAKTDDAPVERPKAPTEQNADAADMGDDRPKAEAKVEQPVQADAGADQAQTVETDAVDPMAVAAAVPTQTDPTVQVVVKTAENIQNVQADGAQKSDGQAQKSADAGDAGAVIDAAGQDQATDPALTAQAAGQTAAKTKKAGGQAENAAAKEQADRLAASLDDTGARLDVQVKVADKAARNAQPTATGQETLIAQDLDGLDMPAQFAGNQGNGGQANAQNQGTANAAQQVAANPAMDMASRQAMDARPFAAALAAQAEPVAQTQTNAGSANSQQPQNVGGLNGTGGPQGAAKTAQPQAAQAPRPQQMPQQHEVMEQVKVQIAKHGAAGDTIKIQLKPVELGSIEVKLEVAKDGSVSGTVIADNKDTLTMLKNDSRALEKALSDAGLKTDAGSLEFSLRGDNQQAQNQQGQDTRKSRRQKLAEATGIDLSAQAQAQAQARMNSARSGVDIQV